jgi:peptidoglycan/LPS O-acetylase OafA/YrhL
MADKGGARIACLDGLRAVSISLVVLGHLAGTAGFPIGTPKVFLPFLASLGGRGFFVISGFLITRLLLQEQAARGSIFLGVFYFRRIFRILVPYYAFLAGMALASHLGWIQLGPGDMGYALTYTSNYHFHGEWPLAHTWSLAVEEQFYLIWPALLVLLGVRRALWLAGAYLALAPFGRFVGWSFPALQEGMGHTFFTVADTIAAGCVLAGVTDKLWKSPRYRALLSSRWFVLLPAAMIASGVFDNRPRIAFSIGAILVSVGAALCVDRCLRLPDALATRILAWTPIVAIGRASYSIYLWQQPFLNRTSAGAATHFPVNLLAVAAVATLSFFLIEQPAMSARAALEPWVRRVLGRSRVPAVPAVSAPHA